MKPTQHPATTKILDQILSTLKSAQSFCLSGHQNPDGDVVGSELALASLINRLGPGKEIHIKNAGAAPRGLSFLPGVAAVKNVDRIDGKYDAVIVFECSGADRMGNIIDLKSQAGTVINIDHHLHNPNFGDINFVQPETASTAELIYAIFERSGLPVLHDEAVCIYTGMVSDTGWFRYSNTTPATHRIAAALLEARVPVSDIAERVFMNRSLPAMRLIGWVVSHMKFVMNDRVAVLTIPHDVYTDLGAGPDDTEEIVNIGLQADSVVVSVLLKEKQNPPAVKVSLRSKGTVDINQIARAFGGGGHRNASGCSVDGSLANAETSILDELRRLF